MKFKAANRELQESLLYTRAILANSPYGVFIADDRGPSWMLIRQHQPSRASARVNLSGRVSGNLFRPELKAPAWTLLDNAKRGRTSGEFPMLRGDGSMRYWSVETVALSDKRYLGFVMDITRRRNDEATRKRQHRFIESLIETIPTPVFYKDRDLGYISCNRAYEDFTGKKRDEITGRTVFRSTSTSLRENTMKGTVSFLHLAATSIMKDG